MALIKRRLLVSVRGDLWLSSLDFRRFDAYFAGILRVINYGSISIFGTFRFDLNHRSAFLNLGSVF
jgi:hypothetical protein